VSNCQMNVIHEQWWQNLIFLYKKLCVVLQDKSM